MSSVLPVEKVSQVMGIRQWKSNSSHRYYKRHAVLRLISMYLYCMYLIYYIKYAFNIYQRKIINHVLVKVKIDPLNSKCATELCLDERKIYRFILAQS